MGWNPFADIGHLVQQGWDTMAKLPASGEATLSALNQGFQGKLSWNPYEKGKAGVWDYAAGGSQLSQNSEARSIGRAVGSYFAGNALGGLAGGAGTAAGEAGAAGGTMGAGADAADAAWGGYGAGAAEAGAGAGSAASSAGGGGDALDGWLNLNGLGPDNYVAGGDAAGPGAFGPMGAGESGGGGSSMYDQMMKYLKGKKGMDLARMGLGAYGLMQARKNNSNFSMPDASQMPNMPGYKAGLDAVQAANAAQGYTGSSNATAAIGKYGASFYNDYFNQKMMSAQGQTQNGNNSIGSLAMLLGGAFGS